MTSGTVTITPYAQAGTVIIAPAIVLRLSRPGGRGPAANVSLPQAKAVGVPGRASNATGTA
jgi:hypothetical protein